MHGPQVPPPGVSPRGPPSLELGVAHGPAGADQVGDGAEQAGVLAQPARPAGVPHAIVEHLALPPRPHRGGPPAAGARPAAVEAPAAVHQATEARPPLTAPAAP